MIPLMAVEDTLDQVKVGSKVKVYANDFAMCAYIRYLAEQEEYDLVNFVEGDSDRMSLFVLQKVKD